MQRVRFQEERLIDKFVAEGGSESERVVYVTRDWPVLLRRN